MARIAGVDLPRNKALGFALTYIYGIGRTRALEICEKAGIDPSFKSDNITDSDITALRRVIDDDYVVEGDLRREISNNMKRLMDIGCYRGLRHRKGMPARGQNTQKNCRTRKGPRRGVVRKKINK